MVLKLVWYQIMKSQLVSVPGSSLGMCGQESSASAPTHPRQSHPRSTATRALTESGTGRKEENVRGNVSKEKEGSTENTSRQPGG